ncbi:MAG: arginyl-tRNA ligase ArgS [Parcubacteria group bacterium Gr01-1014_20]|nr:MAG: arginyl-tRNA ligase ArgS [Parcubacteria group bacterium Gr01-1014_20]
MFMKAEITKLVERVAGTDQFEILVPERDSFGHYSTNVAMRMAKQSGRNPVELARELIVRISAGAPRGVFLKIEAAAPGFINFWLTKEFLQKEGFRALGNKSFGKTNLGRGKKVIFEYSDPNIAKRMHVGHLRATIIGDALANIYEFLGYKVVRWNYIGDWGTQFGKMIVAYKLWGNKVAVQKNPIEELQRLYVKFHEEMERSPDLEERGQEEFKKLEEGNGGNKKLWEWFKRESLREFDRIYQLLGVKFDVTIGEAFYEKGLKKLVADLKSKGVAKESEGSLIVTLEKFGLPPALVQKSDGASLYMTRDIANIKYRLAKYKPVKMFYVVGNEQSLHFEQLFKVAEILKLNKAELKHLKFGLVLDEDGQKFATREGRVVLLDDLINKAMALALEIVDRKNPGLSKKDKEKVARAVGIGALKYNDLKENRHSDVTFNWGQMLNISGNSGPYLQYTYARLASILGKNKKQKTNNKKTKPDFKLLDKKEELDLIRKVLQFPDAISEAHDSLLTSNFSNYLYELASLANRFYETTPVIKEPDVARRGARVGLIQVTNRVIKAGLGLLGIRALGSI